MTCEDDTPARMTWDIQMYEPHSKVWISRGSGRATTTAAPADIARAVLAGYLAGNPPRYGETFQATARADGAEPVTVNAADLDTDAVTADPAVWKALPLYLRAALPDAG
jgi:hypothetical protein